MDIGGTFTDLIVVNDETGEFALGKTLTTPRDPSQGIETGLVETVGRAGIGAGKIRQIIHGATFVTNAIIERKGDRTALLATAGGRPGACGEFIVNDGEPPQPKALVTLAPRSRVQLNPPGGGGHGDPFERDPERVFQCVVDGYVSLEAAEREYGVVILYLGTPGQLVRLPSHYAIDPEATRRRRSR